MWPRRTVEAGPQLADAVQEGGDGPQRAGVTAAVGDGDERGAAGGGIGVGVPFESYAAELAAAVGP